MYYLYLYTGQKATSAKYCTSMSCMPSYPNTTTMSSGTNDVIWNFIESYRRDKKDHKTQGKIRKSWGTSYHDIQMGLMIGVEHEP